jgi:hypothetical protein
MGQKRDDLRKYGLAGSKVLVEAAELGKKSKPAIFFDFDEEKLATYTRDFLGIQPEVRMSHAYTLQALRKPLPPPCAPGQLSSFPRGSVPEQVRLWVWAGAAATASGARGAGE